MKKGIVLVFTLGLLTLFTVNTHAELILSQDFSFQYTENTTLFGYRHWYSDCSTPDSGCNTELYVPFGGTANTYTATINDSNYGDFNNLVNLLLSNSFASGIQYESQNFTIVTQSLAHLPFPDSTITSITLTTINKYSSDFPYTNYIDYKIEYFGDFLVAPVPEPSTFLLLGAGLGMLGIVAIRKRKKS